MTVMQLQKTGVDILHPFVPPKGDICYIKKLAPELLLRIFELACIGVRIKGMTEVDTTDYWDKHFGQAKAAEEWADVETGQGLEEEEEEEESGDEDEDDDDDEDEDKIDDEYVDVDAERGDGTDDVVYDEGAIDATGSSESDLPFQVALSHVCRQWRNIALSNPMLWTSIRVTPRIPPPYELVSKQLERSKGLPIDFNIDLQFYEDSDEGAPDAGFMFLIDILIPHIHRWHNSMVTFSEYHPMYLLLSRLSIPAPQLTKLQLFDFTHEITKELNSFKYPTMSKHFTLFSGSAPLLTTIILYGVHVNWSQPWIASASNLKNLLLGFHPEDVRPSWAQFATILHGAIVLEVLTLRESGPSGEPAKWIIEPMPGSPAYLNAPIQLPRVTDFTLMCHSQAYALGLFRKLYFPALKKLSLDLSNDDYTDVIHELAQPVTPPSLSLVHEPLPSLLSRLDSLKIQRICCKSESIMTLYDELENLTTLMLSMGHIRSEFLSVLALPRTSTREGGIWLPRLVTLYVSGACAHGLIEVVQRRKDAGVPLSSLCVEKFCAVFKKDVEWLRENLETFKFLLGW